jgi:hypothetical protein
MRNAGYNSFIIKSYSITMSMRKKISTPICGKYAGFIRTLEVHNTNQIIL